MDPESDPVTQSPRPGIAGAGRGAGDCNPHAGARRLMIGPSTDPSMIYSPSEPQANQPGEGINSSRGCTVPGERRIGVAEHGE